MIIKDCYRLSFRKDRQVRAQVAFIPQKLPWEWWRKAGALEGNGSPHV